MAKRKMKATAAETSGRRGRLPRTEESETEDRDEREDREDREEEELADAKFPAVSDARASQEPDPREVENMTERIFRSVLSRYGWERHGGRIEHIGGQQTRDRHR